ncbi:RICIN domain-containing protein [Kitasatospora sp. NPDC092948]|uniref:RICIN domain-containing protein n=1 Tax=Kitasatospora sp. NPDC092948 TaxID=3364088 RepID=UPI003820D2A8
MAVDWPTEPFVLRLHRDPSLVAQAAEGRDGGVVGLVREGVGEPQLWVAERFRVAQSRIRHAATGLYLTAEGSGAGAAVTLRPKFEDTGSDTAYWRQTWRAYVQSGTERLKAINDLSGCVLGLAPPAEAAAGRPLVLETNTGAQDLTCTAWAPAVPVVAAPDPVVELAPGTGRVRVTAKVYEPRSRVIESIYEPYLLEVAGRTLAAGTTLDSFAFDDYSRTAWYWQGKEGGLTAWTEGFEGSDTVRKTFHRLAGDPARYVDADEVDVNYHYVAPKVVARTNFPARLFAPVVDSNMLIRTDFRMNSGDAFYNQPERREGLYFPKVDGAGTVVAWHKTWLADNDTVRKVFLCFDGRYFIDERDITWATD